MTYANDVIGFDSTVYGKREAKEATSVYCDLCAETALGLNPAHNPNDPYGPDRLLRDGFNWHPDGQGGGLRPCAVCRKEV